MDEELFIKLRYCFAGGYTLPQYCVDNEIKKPLFVLEKKFACFLREVYAQFKYDGRLSPQFCFVGGEEEGIKFDLRHTLGLFWTNVLLKNFSAMNLDDFDKIILLTKQKFDINDKKTIRFAELEKFFIQQSCVTIPLLNFLRRYPKVKLILTNFPLIQRYKDGKEFESKLLDANQWRRIILANKGKPIETPLDKFGYTNAQVVELMFSNKSKRNADGTSSMIDENYPLRRIQKYASWSQANDT